MELDLENQTRRIGHDIFTAARAYQPEFSPVQWLDNQLMEWGMRDEHVKAHLFRFIDVLPVLNQTQQVMVHMREYSSQVQERLPGPVRFGLKMLPRDGVLASIISSAAKTNTRRLARRFITASNLAEAAKAIPLLRQQNLAYTVDVLGEAILSDAEATHYQNRYLELIAGLVEIDRTLAPNALLDRDPYGKVPRVNVSVKFSALYSQFDPIAPEKTSAAVRERLRPILRLAKKLAVFINIDMEQHSFKDLTLRIFREIFSEPEFNDWPGVGIAIQAYLRSCGDDLHQLADWAHKRGTPAWVRLVKGAYWDYETIIAAQNDWPVPVYIDKAETDANFETQTTFLLENHKLLRPAIASHNIRSISHALAKAQQLGLPPRSFEFQMLYGMADHIKAALVSRQQRVRVYAPMGELLPGMAYLVRRLLENTSNESFLRAGFHENTPEEKLLMNPLTQVKKRSDANRSPYSPRNAETFKNEPLTDFSRADAREMMQSALKEVADELGKQYPLVINGKNLTSGKWIDSINPSHTDQIVGQCASATVEQSLQAIAAAKQAFKSWRDTPPEERADYLFKMADIMRRRRFELSAWEVYESGKQWREADADVAEAIDYCDYYAREMLRLSKPQDRDVPGEENTYFYDARGVALIIAPWNFPLAILCGMTISALVTGNTAIMKPAEQSPIIAAKLMEIFQEAGLPAGVVHYLPGIGEEIGPALVNHPDIALIAFTGSRAVGLSINENASKTPAGQDHVKRVITEMGGKNAIIIDDDADLDEAVVGVAHSAFGYAGQKCSACSRVIVLEPIYDMFVKRLIEITKSLQVGPAEDPGNFVGPVIDAEARNRILTFIEKAKKESRLVVPESSSPSPSQGEGRGEGSAAGSKPDSLIIPPHVFADVSPNAAIAREEIFGPVLAVIKTKDLTSALEIANSTAYALTGGIYSRSPDNIARARREFRVGNLYINRKITGALVDRQPFGGFKLSGIGSKAGGPDYLLQFVIPRVITENTLRRGFAPAQVAEAASAAE